jgi:uncharacterized protein with HEPN domain
VPPRTWPERVTDIIDAAQRILEITKGLDATSFASDRTIRDATLYNLVIIGEAARFVPADVQAKCPDVDWHGLKDMRNFVAHAYHAVSYQRVWRTFTRDLPGVIASLQGLLADETLREGRG